MLDYLGCTVRINAYTTSTFYLLPLGRRLLLAREGQAVIPFAGPATNVAEGFDERQVLFR